MNGMIDDEGYFGLQGKLGRTYAKNNAFPRHGWREE